MDAWVTAMGISVTKMIDGYPELTFYDEHTVEAFEKLKALYRAGRVKGPAAFFGNLLGVKPIIISDANGEQAAFKKVKGRRTSFDEIVNLLKESIENPEEQTVYIVHADCADEEVKALRSSLVAAIPAKDIHTGLIGPIIGASIGPDAIGVFAFGKKITFRVGDK